MRHAEFLGKACEGKGADQTVGRPLERRLLEILKDCFGALEAVAFSSIKLARYAPEDELSIDLLVAESVLEFGSNLREAHRDTIEWARERGVGPVS